MVLLSGGKAQGLRKEGARGFNGCRHAVVPNEGKHLGGRGQTRDQRVVAQKAAELLI